MSPRLRAILVDCDNTLYPPETRFLEAGDRRICEFIARRLNLPLDQADALRLRLWREYGTTARGLAEEFGISPEEMCREALESLDFEGLLEPDPELARELRSLGVPLYVFSNSTEAYVLRVLAARGLTGVFAGIFGIAFLGWEGKPSRAAFERVERALPGGCGRLALADDNPQNLMVARRLGWLAVAVGTDAAEAGDLVIPRLHDLGRALRRAGWL
ncbi:MAG: pyrimidine 5'-nucleotidase [Armatimonadetes bacterium]|nr:pyrimidine 5'-nucleotidase [Armatimonadota bacterium]